jgi:hypothetical protein
MQAAIVGYIDCAMLILKSRNGQRALPSLVGCCWGDFYNLVP